MFGREKRNFEVLSGNLNPKFVAGSMRLYNLGPKPPLPWMPAFFQLLQIPRPLPRHSSLPSTQLTPRP